MNRNELPDAYAMMYSVIDKTSFKTTEDELARLQNWDALRSRALILVGNKIDLVRSRAVSTQGNNMTDQRPALLFVYLFVVAESCHLSVAD